MKNEKQLSSVQKDEQKERVHQLRLDISKELDSIYRNVDMAAVLVSVFVTKFLIIQLTKWLWSLIEERMKESQIQSKQNEEQVIINQQRMEQQQIKGEELQQKIAEIKILEEQGRLIEAQNHRQIAEQFRRDFLLELDKLAQDVKRSSQKNISVANFLFRTGILMQVAPWLTVIAGTFVLPTIINRKIFSPLFNYFFPLEKLLQNFLSYQKDEVFLLKKHQELKIYATFANSFQYFIATLMVTSALAQMMSLHHNGNFEEDTKLRGSYVQAGAVIFYFLYKVISSYIQPTHSASKVKEMTTQLQSLFFNQSLKMQTIFDENNNFQSLKLSLPNSKKISLLFNGEKYQISTKKFLSELTLIFYKSGFLVSLEENTLSIWNVKVLSNSQYLLTMKLLQEHIIELANISQFKTQKLEQLTKLTNALGMSGDAWDYFKVENPKTNSTTLKYIVDISSLNDSKKQLLTEQLIKLFGNENVIRRDDCVTVIGWQLADLNLLKKCEAVCFRKEKEPAVVTTEVTTGKQTEHQDKTTTTYVSYKLSKSKKVAASKSVKAKAATVDSTKQDSSVNNNNNNASVGDWKLAALKARYGQDVYKLKAKWLPQGQFYYAVVNYPKINASIENNYQKSQKEGVRKKLNKCMKLLRQADDTFIKSNNPKSKDKSHGAGVFSSGSEIFQDARGQIRNGLFKVKTKNGTRLHGDVVHRNLNTNENQTEQVTLVKFRGFVPNKY